MPMGRTERRPPEAWRERLCLGVLEFGAMKAVDVERRRDDRNSLMFFFCNYNFHVLVISRPLFLLGLVSMQALNWSVGLSTSIVALQMLPSSSPMRSSPSFAHFEERRRLMSRILMTPLTLKPY